MLLMFFSKKWITSNRPLPVLDCERLGRETNTSNIIARGKVHKFFGFQEGFVTYVHRVPVENAFFKIAVEIELQSDCFTHVFD